MWCRTRSLRDWRSYSELQSAQDHIAELALLGEGRASEAQIDLASGKQSNASRLRR